MGRTLDGAGEQTEDAETNSRGVIKEHPVLGRPRHRKSVSTPHVHATLRILPVLDDVYPTSEESRAQVSGKEIEDVDNHTA